jgi:hypothetical protein
VNGRRRLLAALAGVPLLQANLTFAQAALLVRLAGAWKNPVHPWQTGF